MDPGASHKQAEWEGCMKSQRNYSNFSPRIKGNSYAGTDMCGHVSHALSDRLAPVLISEKGFA